MSDMKSGVPLPAGVTLAPLGPGEPWFDEAVELYRDTWSEESDEDVRTVAAFFGSHARMLDYGGLVALRAGQVAGFGFGERSLPGGWWHEIVAAQVGPEHPALRDAWGLVEIAVAREERGRGIGGALLEALLAAQPCGRALLSTQVANAGARRFYERHGWTYLIAAIAFQDGAEPYAVMRRELAG